MRMIDGDELVMWLSQWMTSSFGTEPTEETEAIRKVCDAVGDMVKDLAKDTSGDNISRQAAIDALEEQLDYLHKLNEDENPTAESNWYGVNWARNTIADLPSAEPEEVYCPMASIACFANGKEVAWCLTCPHISEEDRELVKKAVEGSQPKTGRWEPPSADVPNCCSVCGEDWDKYVYGQDVWYTGEVPKFCPHCGADMRGEQGE